jgi:hypothetical protein
VLRNAAARLPSDLSIRERLAWILATSPDAAVRAPEEALQLANAVAGQSDHPRPLATLAAAQSAAGKPDLALQTARSALSAARTRQDEELIAIIEWMIQGLQSGRAVFDLPNPPG